MKHMIVGKIFTAQAPADFVKQNQPFKFRVSENKAVPVQRCVACEINNFFDRGNSAHTHP